jgi:hypothetical protein
MHLTKARRSSQAPSRQRRAGVFAAAFVALVALAPASRATVLLLPTNYTIGAGARQVVGTFTDAQLGATDTQLVITYSTTRSDVSNTGDSWLTLGANANGPENFKVATESDIGLLTRTQSGSPGQHQIFDDGASAGSAASAFTLAGSAVQITIDVPNKFNGTSNVVFQIDEGTTTFAMADRTLTRSMDWDRTPAPGSAAFVLAAQGFAHDVQNFTVQAVPEPTSLALVALAATATLGRRRRRRGGV